MTPTPNKTPAKKSAPERRQLVAQLFSVRDYCKTPAAIAASFKKIARIGYSMAQISGLGPIDAPTLARIAQDSGVAIVASHIGLATWETLYAEQIAYLHTLGCRHSAVPYLPLELRRDLAGWKAVARRLAKLQKKCAADGITLQYHNHDFEFVKFKDRTGLRLLLDEAPALQAELDLCWVARGGGDPAQWILDVKGRMDQVHFKDSVMVLEPSETPDAPPQLRARFAEIGSGNLNWPRILECCEKTGVKHYIVEQDGDWLGGDPFKSLAASYRFLNGLGLK